MSIFDFDIPIFFIIFFIITFPFLIFQLVIMWKFQILGEIPLILEEFPVFKTSHWEYHRSANKVTVFLKALNLDNAKTIKLTLQVDDINHLYTAY